MTGPSDIRQIVEHEKRNPCQLWTDRLNEEMIDRLIAETAVSATLRFYSTRPMKGLCEYVALLAMRSALRAERAAGMRDAAAECLRQTEQNTSYGDYDMALGAECCSVAILAAAEKLEAGK